MNNYKIKMDEALNQQIMMEAALKEMFIENEVLKLGPQQALDVIEMVKQLAGLNLAETLSQQKISSLESITQS